MKRAAVSATRAQPALRGALLAALLAVPACAAPPPPPPQDKPDAADASELPVKCDTALVACGTSCTTLDSDPRNCGVCGRTCVIPNATAACRGGACAIAACADGYIDADGKLANGCELASSCVAGKDCTTACASSGVTACDGGKTQCMPPAERCNGQDDDCNGRCDEGALPGCRIGVHRSLGGGGHFYTTDLTAAMSAPYTIESINYFYLYQSGLAGGQAFYLCKKPSGLYFLTLSSTCEVLNIPGVQLGYIATDSRCDAQPLYRLFNDRSGDHFYTVSDAEQKSAVTMYGYRLESVVGYVWLAP
jgi:hypothetical protein